MLNIEKYKNEIIDEWIKSEDCDLLENIKCVAHKNGLKDTHGIRDIQCRKIMDWLCDEYQEPLLNDKEKDLLKYLIGAFPSIYSAYVGEHFIFLKSKDDGQLVTFSKMHGFQNLESRKEYTLKELGL